MSQVNDLRSAIELLKTIPGQYIETDEPVDPKAELMAGNWVDLMVDRMAEMLVVLKVAN